jgi:hypothetical protein
MLPRRVLEIREALMSEKVDQWLVRYRRDQDHRLKLERMRAETDAVIAKWKASSTRLRRAEEASHVRAIKLRYSTSLAIGKLSLAMAEAYHDVVVEESCIVMAEDKPFLDAWRADAAAHARRLGVEIVWAPDCIRQGYAWSASKRIEVRPITSAGLYVVVLHELGHCAEPCRADHEPKKKDDGGVACASCELAAWRWAIRHAKPTWTRAMHQRLITALRTYRRYGTFGEQREVDELASDMGFYQTLMTRLHY